MDHQQRAELVRRLFSLMTAKLEEAAVEAAEGQGPEQDYLLQIGRTERIEMLARDVGVLAESVAAIVQGNART